MSRGQQSMQQTPPIHHTMLSIVGRLSSPDMSATGSFRGAPPVKK
ncbi:hypothetical protein MY10362_004913 [Beauveria mimosiformis]